MPRDNAGKQAVNIVDSIFFGTAVETTDSDLFR